MGEFRNLSTSTIELLGLFGLHFGSECCHRRGIVLSNYHAWRILRATTVSEWTRLAIGCRSEIGVFGPTFACTRLVEFQHLFHWTRQRIGCLIVSKFVWIKLRLDAA